MAKPKALPGPLIARCSRRLVAAALALLGCTDPLLPNDRPADLAAPAPDLTAVRYRLRWRVFLDDERADCAQAGVARVIAFPSFPSTSPLQTGSATFDCLPGEGTLSLPSTGLSTTKAIAAVDGSGVPLAWAFYPIDSPLPTGPGLQELPDAVFHVTREPVPAMNAIFDAARAWYRAHGALAPSVSWTPNGPGVCCSQSDQLCALAKFQPELAQSWRDLGVQLPVERFHFSYRYVASGTSFSIEAAADLDCDGRLFSSHRIDATLVGGDFARGAVVVTNRGL